MNHLETVHTAATLETWSLIDRTRQAHGVSVVLGDSGRGKTTMLRAYCLQAEGEWPRRRVLLHRAEVVNTPLSVLRALLASLDVVFEGGTREAFPALAAEMVLRGVDAIVIDDAQRLASHTLDILRGLHERTRVSLVLCGTPRLRRLLCKRCPELAHRAVYVHEVVTAEEDDAFDLVRHTPAGRRPCGQALALARVLVEASGGNMRRMSQLLEEAQRKARASHRGLDPRLLDRVAADLDRNQERLGV